MDMVDDMDRAQGAGLQGGQGPRGGAGETRSGPSPSTSRSWPSTRATGRRWSSWSACTCAWARWDDLKDVYTRKADLATDPQEKKQLLFVLGQVYDRELGNPEKAIETYSAILDIDPDDCEAVQALDRLYGQTERWFDLLPVLERQTELSPSAAEVVSLRFRIGELWREQLKDPARAAEAYRQVLAMEPGARADAAGAGGDDARARSPCWPPRCWSRSTRPRASGIGWRRCTR